MSSREVLQYEDRLEHLIRYSPSDDSLDEFQAHWACYLCVLVSGYLEVAIPAILSEYASAQAGPFVSNYVQKQLGHFQNPRFGKIIDLTNAFNPLWGESLQHNSEGAIKDHVDSIVANRNNIAHGRNTGVTLVRVRDWFSSAKKLIRSLEKLCDQ